MIQFYRNICLNIFYRSIKESSTHKIIIVVFRWWFLLFLLYFFGLFLWLFFSNWGFSCSSVIIARSWTRSSYTCNSLCNKFMNFFTFTSLYNSVDIFIWDSGLYITKYFLDISSSFIKKYNYWCLSCLKETKEHM